MPEVCQSDILESVAGKSNSGKPGNWVIWMSRNEFL